MSSVPLCYVPRQKSNSAAASSLNDVNAIFGRPGYCAVITHLQARAVGGTNKFVQMTATDGISASLVKSAEDQAAAGAMLSVETEGEIYFGENVSVVVQIATDGTATGVGYTLDYYYRPCPVGFTG